MTSAKTPEDREANAVDMFAVMDALAADKRYLEGDTCRGIRETLHALTKAYGMAVNDVASAGATLLVARPDPLFAKDCYSQLMYSLILATASEAASRTEQNIGALMTDTAHALMIMDCGDARGAALRIASVNLRCTKARATALVDMMHLAALMRGVSTYYTDTSDIREAFFTKATHIVNTAVALFPHEALVSSDARRILKEKVNVKGQAYP